MRPKEPPYKTDHRMFPHHAINIERISNPYAGDRFSFAIQSQNKRELCK